MESVGFDQLLRTNFGPFTSMGDDISGFRMNIRKNIRLLHVDTNF